MSNWVRIIADPRKAGMLTYECEAGHQWDKPLVVFGQPYVYPPNECPTCVEKELDAKHS